MTIAESDGTRLAYIAEVTEGVTPATPAFSTARMTGESLDAAKETVKSNEIRADKNIADVLHVGTNVAGAINAEFSYGSFDDWIESAFRGTWAANVLVNGLDRHTFTFEKTFEQGAADTFVRYRGCFIDSFDLSIQSKSIITAVFNVMGLAGEASAAAIIVGATYGAATTTAVMTAGNEVGTVTVGALGGTLKGIDMSFKSNNRGQAQIGSNDLAGIATGQFEVTGSLDLYFEDGAIYDAIRDHDAVVLTVNLGSTTLEKYTLVLNKVRLLDGPPVAGGNGQDVSFTVGFQAVFNATDSGSAKLTRGVA